MRKFYLTISSLLIPFILIVANPVVLGKNINENQSEKLSGIIGNLSDGVLQSAQTFNVDKSSTATLNFASMPEPEPITVSSSMPVLITSSSSSNKTPSKSSSISIAPIIVTYYNVSMTDGDSALAELIQRESGGNIYSVSPSGEHFGLGQLLNLHYQRYIGKSYSQVRNSAPEQIKAMRAYIADRYGTTQAALQHSFDYNWY